MNSLDATEFLTENAKDHNLLYAAGKTYHESWGYGVWSPRPASPAIYLAGDNTLRVGGGPPICAWAGTGVKLDDCQVQTQQFSYKLYKDGKLLGEGQSVTTAVDPVKPHWYSAEMTAGRSGKVSLSTQVTARWYFQVGGTTRTETAKLIVIKHNQVQPGMFRISPAGLDDRNQVDHTAPTSIALSVAEFGDVASMSLESSDDSGKTWHSVPVTGTGANRTAKLPAAGKPGMVSLRVGAKSANGAMVQETVINAYGVR
jgi:hypothetical protein